METSLVAEVEILARALKDVPYERRRKNVDEAIASQRQFRGQCVLPLKLKP